MPSGASNCGPPRYCFQTPKMSSALVAMRSHGPVTPLAQGTSDFTMFGGKAADGEAAANVAAWVACNASARCVELARLLTASTRNKTTTATTLINPDLMFITSLLTTLAGPRYEALRHIEPIETLSRNTRLP